jgi:putative peptidoglycan lipid II flippase
LNKLFHSSIFISLAYLLLRIGGFLRELTLSAVYGANNVTDAFLVAFTVPNLIISFLVAATGTTYIAVHSSLSVKERKQFTSNLLSVFALISAVLAIAFYLFPGFFVSLLASRADVEMTNTAEQLLRYMGWSVIPMLLAAVLSAHLQTKGKFFVATVYQIFINLFIIIGVILSPKQLWWMGVGMVVGNVVSLIFLLVHNRGLVYRPTFRLNDKHLKHFFVLLAPIVLSTLMAEINTIVDRNMATSIGEGIASTLNYASKVQGVFTAFIGTAIGTAFFPKMSELSASGVMG